MFFRNQPYFCSRHTLSITSPVLCFLRSLLPRLLTQPDFPFQSVYLFLALPFPSLSLCLTLSVPIFGLILSSLIFFYPLQSSSVPLSQTGKRNRVFPQVSCIQSVGGTCGRHRERETIEELSCGLSKIETGTEKETLE